MTVVQLYREALAYQDHDAALAVLLGLTESDVGQLRDEQELQRLGPEGVLAIRPAWVDEQLRDRILDDDWRRLAIGIALGALIARDRYDVAERGRA